MGARRRLRRIQPASLGLALLCAMLPFAGCVCEQGEATRQALPGDNLNNPNIEPAPPPPSREIATWDFTSDPEPALLSLWPQDSLAPPRKKLGILTTKDGDDLVALTDGPDPQFTWNFEKPLHAAVLSIELESQKVGDLQLFWTSVDCQVFQEACSMVERAGIGKATIDFVLTFGQAIRALRLDLPHERGTKLRFRRIHLISKPRLSAGYWPREGHTEVTRIPGGLRISSQEPDPWLTFATPWLDAAQARAVEVEMLAPEGTSPHLFWHGTTCEHFKGECSVPLKPVANEPHHFAADLAGIATWRGRVRGLRFDPIADAGECVLQKLSFVRANAKP
jgi:hypothetical protein